MATIELELEVDPGPDLSAFLDKTTTSDWHGSGPFSGISIAVRSSEQGHGFGLGTVITVVLTIGAGVASDLAADALRSAVGGVIRRVKSSRGRTDGSKAELTSIIENERGESSDTSED